MMNQHRSHKMPVIKCKVAGVLWEVGDYQSICKDIRCRTNSICGAQPNKKCSNKIKWGEHEIK